MNWKEIFMFCIFIISYSFFVILVHDYYTSKKPTTLDDAEFSSVNKEASKYNISSNPPYIGYQSAPSISTGQSNYIMTEEANKYDLLVPYDDTGEYNVIIGVGNTTGGYSYCVLIGTNLTADHDYQVKIGNSVIQTSREMTKEEYKELYDSLMMWVNPHEIEE